MTFLAYLSLLSALFLTALLGFCLGATGFALIGVAVTSRGSPEYTDALRAFGAFGRRSVVVAGALVVALAGLLAWWEHLPEHLPFALSP